MGAERLDAELLGDHDYLVRVGHGDGSAEIRVHASPTVVHRVAADGNDETRIIEATVAFLMRRQRADDLPSSLDLDDVAAAYDDYIDVIRRQLAL